MAERFEDFGGICASIFRVETADFSETSVNTLISQKIYFHIRCLLKL
jgi:hypothetical protein